MKTTEKMIEELQDLVKIQCNDGNWNYSEYMHGMANGLICALSVVSDEEPVYLSKPDEWLCDKEFSGLTCVASAENPGVPAKESL